MALVSQTAPPLASSCAPVMWIAECATSEATSTTTPSTLKAQTSVRSPITISRRWS